MLEIYLRQEVSSMVKNSFNEENAYLKKMPQIRDMERTGREKREDLNMKNQEFGAIYGFNIKNLFLFHNYYYYPFLAKSFAPVKSIATRDSFPTTHELCPGGITA
jgi:hypothetical protein